MHKLLRRAGILGSLLALAAVAALGGQASAAPQSPLGAAAARTATAATAAGGLRVVASGLGDRAGIVGAARLALEEVLSADAVDRALAGRQQVVGRPVP